MIADMNPDFPKKAQDIINDIENKTVLGASRHVRMIVIACRIQVEQSQTSNSKELLDLINQTMQYFSNTRGKETIAVQNAFAWITKGLQSRQNSPVRDTRDFFIKRCDEFINLSKRAVDKIALYGSNLISNFQSILVFDYSSSVIAILCRMGREGKTLSLIVPESRTVNGGRPIVEESVKSGHTAHIIPDIAIGHFLRQVDAVLVGVETVFSDGSFTNTLGTHMVAEMAKKIYVPVYAATELLKVNMNSITGMNGIIEHHNLGTLFDYPQSFSIPERVSVLAPSVDWIPASCLEAYITDFGVVNPSMVWAHARESFPPENVLFALESKKEV